MDMIQPPPGEVPDLAGPDGTDSVRRAGRRRWLWTFRGICLLAAAVSGPASSAGWVYQQTSPSAEVQNAWLTASVSVVDTPTPAAPVITFAQPPDVTVGTPVVLSASVSPPGLPLLFGSDTPLVCTAARASVTAVAVGTCTITAYQDGEPPRAALPVTRSFQVNRVKAGLAAQTITFGQPPEVRAGVPVTLSASASSGLPVSFGSDTPSVCMVAGASVTMVAAGTCSVTASQGGSGRYAAAPDVTRSFQVTLVASKAAGVRVIFLAAVILAAAAATLLVRRRRLRSHPLTAPDVRAVPDNGPPGLVSVHNTGTDATHTVRIEPSPGASTTTIKEARP
jgi:hypothetical protein